MASHSQPADTVDRAIAKRRARNRVSQKSFRERQARYIKDLERRVAESSHSESARLKASEQECRRLREALAAAQSKINTLVTSLSGVAQNIAQSIDPTAIISVDEGDKGSVSAEEENAATDDDSDNEEQTERVTSSSHVRDHGSGTTTNPEAVTFPPMRMEGTSPGQRAVDDSNAQITVPIQTHQTSVVAQNAQSLDLNALFHTGEYAEPLESTGRTCTDQAFSYMQDMQQLPTEWAQTATHTQLSYAPTPLLFPSPTATEKLMPQKSHLELSFPPGSARFPSIFSAHLAVCEYFTKQNHAYRDRALPNGAEPFGKLISTMVHAFVNTCWPEMRVWWAYIQSSKVVEKLMRWKLDPCLDTYNALPITHRPTALQLCTAYPAIIDWVFFPSIRDRMIEVYSHSWLLDRISCELVRAYVVEAELTKIVSGMDNLPPQKGYFRIWDIVQTISLGDLMTNSTTESNAALWELDAHADPEIFAVPTSPFEIELPSTGELWTKMPLEQIFQSRKAALKLFNLLRMDDRRTVKVDPAFAAAHPELCDDASIIASGLDCTLHNNKIQVPLPKALNREAIMNYKALLWKTDM